MNLTPEELMEIEERLKDVDISYGEIIKNWGEFFKEFFNRVKLTKELEDEIFTIKGNKIEIDLEVLFWEAIADAGLWDYFID